MKNLNKYINEAWSGVKKYTNNAEIEAWCDEMDIKNYTINSQGEIDVDGGVDLGRNTFDELPYKFGKIKKWFNLAECKNLISLKNCPNYIEGSFDVDGCSKLDSLKECPKKVGSTFYCRKCKRKFTKEEVMSLCKLKKENIFV